ncbi:MAG: hypothetical protein V1859_10560 [archaeon]
MSDKREKEFEELKSFVKKELDDINTIEETSKENIKTESRKLEEVSIIKNTINVMYNSMNDISKETLVSMPKEDYSTYTGSIKGIINLSPSISKMKEETIEAEKLLVNHVGTYGAVGSLTSSGTASIASFINCYPTYFPKKHTYIEEFKQYDKLREDINLIKVELPKMNNIAASDFEKFLRRYNTFSPDESKYIEVFGLRSLFFFKCIFKIAEDNKITSNKGKPFTRKQQISYFSTGNITTSAITEPIINQAMTFWSEISEQNTEKDSIKTGNVSKDYVERKYREFISIFASLVSLRKTYVK